MPRAKNSKSATKKTRVPGNYSITTDLRDGQDMNMFGSWRRVPIDTNRDVLPPREVIFNASNEGRQPYELQREASGKGKPQRSSRSMSISQSASPEVKKRGVRRSRRDHTVHDSSSVATTSSGSRGPASTDGQQFLDGIAQYPAMQAQQGVFGLQEKPQMTPAFDNGSFSQPVQTPSTYSSFGVHTGYQPAHDVGMSSMNTAYPQLHNATSTLRFEDEQGYTGREHTRRFHSYGAPDVVQPTSSTGAHDWQPQPSYTPVQYHSSQVNFDPLQMTGPSHVDARFMSAYANTEQGDVPLFNQQWDYTSAGNLVPTGATDFGSQFPMFSSEDASGGFGDYEPTGNAYWAGMPGYSSDGIPDEQHFYPVTDEDRAYISGPSFARSSEPTNTFSNAYDHYRG